MDKLEQLKSKLTEITQLEKALHTARCEAEELFDAPENKEFFAILNEANRLWEHTRWSSSYD